MRLTSDSNILAVVAIVATQRIGRTVSQTSLSTSTIDIVQPDDSYSLAKQGSDDSLVTWESPQALWI